VYKYINIFAESDHVGGYVAQVLFFADCYSLLFIVICSDNRGWMSVNRRFCSS